MEQIGTGRALFRCCVVAWMLTALLNADAYGGEETSAAPKIMVAVRTSSPPVIESWLIISQKGGESEKDKWEGNCFGRPVGCHSNISVTGLLRLAGMNSGIRSKAVNGFLNGLSGFPSTLIC